MVGFCVGMCDVVGAAVDGAMVGLYSVSVGAAVGLEVTSMMMVGLCVPSSSMMVKGPDCVIVGVPVKVVSNIESPLEGHVGAGVSVTPTSAETCDGSAN